MPNLIGERPLDQQRIVLRAPYQAIGHEQLVAMAKIAMPRPRTSDDVVVDEPVKLTLLRTAPKDELPRLYLADEWALWALESGASLEEAEQSSSIGLPYRTVVNEPYLLHTTGPYRHLFDPQDVVPEHAAKDIMHASAGIDRHGRVAVQGFSDQGVSVYANWIAANM
ncbi:MAG: hypothetical protein JWM81_722 [Candidatus Saccharibacteria bacterium]|nr:hypothetical protein [Candidatus Saccharibacteria bacterium]